MSSESLELLKEFERLVSEGGIATYNSYPYIDLEPRYSCEHGLHKWKWYVGFLLEQYYFCELCDKKDFTRFPPYSRS